MVHQSIHNDQHKEHHVYLNPFTSTCHSIASMDSIILHFIHHRLSRRTIILHIRKNLIGISWESNLPHTHPVFGPFTYTAIVFHTLKSVDCILKYLCNAQKRTRYSPLNIAILQRNYILAFTLPPLFRKSSQSQSPNPLKACCPH